MAVMSIVLGLGFMAGLALLFGFIANKALPSLSVNRRAAVAAGALAVLMTSPAYIALTASGAPVVSFAAIVVGTAIMAAIAFPIALVMTRRQPVAPGPGTFD